MTGPTTGFEALEALDPARIHSFSDLLTAMKKTAFGGRRLGEAFEVLKAMIEDPDCFVVMTLSGAMTIAQNGETHLYHAGPGDGASHCLDRRVDGPWHERSRGANAL